MCTMSYSEHAVSAMSSHTVDVIDDSRSKRLSSSTMTSLSIHDFRVINHPRVSLCKSLLRGDSTSPAVLNTRSGASLMAGTAKTSKAIDTKSG